MTTAPRTTVELGVFLPVGTGGWITSTASPQLEASYTYNKRVTLLAEELGLDFALSMAKWRGYGGSSRHWDETLESLSLMSALAEATTRINVWGTVHTMVFHPAVVAKMAAVIDQVSGGRFGLNIVSGSNPFDQGQMGLWQDLDHTQRYDLAREWVTVAKRLWSEGRVDFDGEYFHLEDCVSDPKPATIPPIICAGSSDTGFRFTIENCTASFLLGADQEKFVAVARRAKELAAEAGKDDFKTYGLFTIVPGATDEEAQARVDAFDASADLVALNNQAREYGTDKSLKQNTMANVFIDQGTSAKSLTKAAVVGSPATIAQQLATIVTEGDLDGITIIVPDFIGDLEIVGRDVVRELAALGIRTTAAATQGIPVANEEVHA
ncbi:LLM class flavin-dependent oxidoreductase [Curtobacterium pusillum]|uniref:LLM class flavin-dependent oxidoreductase n=1 Tax=Curtobacterium pusillum TaxID=69373 RepID=UPI0011A08111|nr:LLM class flavin-dependent oxidoreductase [Curtobacterium pusillum]